jgi:hypothetical protein
MKNQINSIEIIISIFCIILLLGGCKKDDNKISYTFTGRLVDYYSGNGVANAMIYIKTTEVNPSRPQEAQLDLFDTTSFEDKILSDSEGFFNKIIEIDSDLKVKRMAA